MYLPTEEGSIGTETDSKGVKRHYRYLSKHLKGCPMGLRTPVPYSKLLRPWAMKLIDRELAIQGLEAKLVEAKKAEPHHVGFDGYYLRAADMYHDEISADEYEALLKRLAEGMGGKVLTGRGWEREDQSWRESKPIVEKHRPKGWDHDVESNAVLGWRQDGSTNTYAVFPSRERAKAFLDAGRMLHKIMLATYKAGTRRGASLLEQLAKDKMTLSAFEEQVRGREKEE